MSSTVALHIRILPDHLEPVGTPLPRIWIGFVLASLCFFCDFAGWLEDSSDARETLFGLGLIFSMAAWVYWLFCIHRLHQILRRASQSTYRIGPWKAVLLLLIPFFNWYWRIRLCNHVATFVNTNNSTLRMKKWWAGGFMVAGSILGTLALVPPIECTSLRWFVLFAVAHHLTRKIRHTVKFRQAIDVARQRQLDLAITAGLGAAFAFVFCKGIVEFYNNTAPMDKVRSGVALLLVSLAVVRFIEPLSERMRMALGAESLHSSMHESKIHKQRAWVMRGFLTAILVFSIFFHSVLHEQFFNINETWPPLLAAMLSSGGVTYFWIAGLRQDPSRAAWLGTLSGAVLAVFICGTLAAVIDQPARHDSARTVAETVGAFASEVQVPKHFPSIPYGRLSTAWPWALFGLVGGAMIDRHKGGRGAYRIAAAILVTATICEIVLFTFFYKGVPMSRWLLMMANLSAVLGWCAGLLLHPSCESVFGQKDGSHEQPSQAATQPIA
jgi:hypothetical protein